MSRNLMAIRLPEISQDVKQYRDSINDDSNLTKSPPSNDDDDESLIDSPKFNNMWIMPHDEVIESHDRLSRNEHGEFRKETPGGIFFIKSQQTKRTNNQDIIQRVASPTLITYKNSEKFSNNSSRLSQNTNNIRESEVEESEDDSYDELTQENNNHLVYFRYDANNSRKPCDFNSRPDLVVGLQTYCKRHLAKRKVARRQAQDEAILIIQTNIDIYMNPWIKLYRTLRPLLKFHKSDRYVDQLKGKIAILKETIKALKMENSLFTEKLNGITQQLMRANGSSSERQIIQKNLNELNQEILSNANCFGSILERKNRKLDEICLNDFPSFGINDDSENELNLEENTFASESETCSISQEVAADSGIMLRKKKCNSTVQYPFSSPVQKDVRSASLGKARDDAEFYRMQVELLREEAECQHQSANTHYEEKIIVLSQRIEQLQNQLTEEINKNYKLKKDLDESLHLLHESKLCENSLKSIVDKLCKQLEEYRDIQPRDYSESREGKEIIDKDTYQKLIYCKEYIENLRNYYKSNPKALQNTILEPGAPYDIFEDWFLQNMPITPQPTAKQMNSANMKAKRPSNLPEFSTPICQNSGTLSPMIISDQSLQRKLKEEILNYSKRLEEEILEKDSMELELNDLRSKLLSCKRDNGRLQEDHQEEIDELRCRHQKKIHELEEQIEEEFRLRQNAENHSKNLEKQLISMKRASEYSELEHVNDERQETERRLKEDVIYYKNSLDRVQEEFEDFKTRNDPHKFRVEIDERDEKITLLTHEKSKLLKDNEILSIKLQTNSGILEDNENRLRQINKEKSALTLRLTQLEQERDEAIKDKALLTGKACADREAVATRSREIEELKAEREILKREVNELRKDFDSTKFDANTEIQTLNMKMRENEKNFIMMKNSLEKEIDQKRLEFQTLQAELEILLNKEKHDKVTIRQLKRRVSDLEDMNAKNLKKISDLERSYQEAAEERDRAKSDFTAARETAEFLRASRTRLDEEVNDSVGEQDGIIYRRLFSRTPNVVTPNEFLNAAFKRKSLCTTIPDDNDMPTPIPEHKQ